jgi:uncharacterized protein (DUF1800 family)
MTLDPKSKAFFALHRFGLGPKAGTIAAIEADPRAALLAELDEADSAPAAGLLASGEAARQAFQFNLKLREARRAARAQAADPAKTAGGTPNLSAQADALPAATAQTRPAVSLPQQIYRQEAHARIDAALNAEIGFVERLTWFWSNHFCVSIAKRAVLPLAGAYEREAIRPHVLGRFEDMLSAAESHPAMLAYLDNARSIGPDSSTGKASGKGLNENLAREILELHTLGVRSVYTQTDVTNFAKVITGWTVIPARQEHGGEFGFDPKMHQPGAQTLIGRSFPGDDIEQGRAALAMLAMQPETAKHVATQLVKHFISDQPLPSLSQKLAKRFMDTDGDLRAVATELIEAPESWEVSKRKVKRPEEWIVSALRATGAMQPDTVSLLQAQRLLGQPLWGPVAPSGFSDDDAVWLDGIAQRLDIANQMARQAAGKVDPDTITEVALGPLASEDTRRAIRRAESRPQALTVLLMAPEFQRR